MCLSLHAISDSFAVAQRCLWFIVLLFCLFPSEFVYIVVIRSMFLHFWRVSVFTCVPFPGFEDGCWA